MTPKDAPYKTAQRLKPTCTLLASSAELRQYQKVKKVSALQIARLTKEKLDAVREVPIADARSGLLEV